MKREAFQAIVQFVYSSSMLCGTNLYICTSVACEQSHIAYSAFIKALKCRETTASQLPPR